MKLLLYLVLLVNPCMFIKAWKSFDNPVKSRCVFSSVALSAFKPPFFLLCSIQRFIVGLCVYLSGREFFILVIKKILFNYYLLESVYFTCGVRFYITINFCLHLDAATCNMYDIYNIDFSSFLLP